MIEIVQMVGQFYWVFGTSWGSGRTSSALFPSNGPFSWRVRTFDLLFGENLWESTPILLNKEPNVRNSPKKASFCWNRGTNVRSTYRYH